VEFDRDKRFESVYSRKVKAGKRRTYFFDVRQTKGSDYFVTITESTRRFEDEGYIRHKIFLYKEDFNRFIENLTDVVEHVKTELMPEYDYEEYARRYDEEDNLEGEQFPKVQETTEEPKNEIPKIESTLPIDKEDEDEEDGEEW
jgi:hypothetical protein